MVVGAVALGFQSRLARHEFVEALGDNRQVSAHDRFVELDKNVARLDVIAVAHEQLRRRYRRSGAAPF